jgi:hypothetical protein
MNNTISSILALAAFVSVIAGGLYGLDRTYARDTKANQIAAKTEQIYQYVQYVDKSLQLKKEDDLRNSLQSNYFNWEKEYGPNGEKTTDPKVKERMFQIKQQIGVQDQKIQELQKSLVAPTIHSAP